MITIEEMRAWKRAKDEEEMRRQNAVHTEIEELTSKIMDMMGELNEMIEFGRTALACGLIPSYVEHWDRDYGHYMSSNYERQEDYEEVGSIFARMCVWSDGIYHYVGYLADDFGNIMGIGIRNGGANGDFDLVINGHGVCWCPIDGRATYDEETHLKNLRKFFSRYTAWKNRVNGHVKETMER